MIIFEAISKQGLDDLEHHLGITISEAVSDMAVLLDEVSGRVYYGKKPEASLPTPSSDGAAEPHRTSPEGIIPKKSYFRILVIGGVVVFVIAAIITCVYLVEFMTPPGPLSNSTLSNSTEDPQVTLDFDEVGGGGVSYSKETSF